jgi:hypothetical protein
MRGVSRWALSSSDVGECDPRQGAYVGDAPHSLQLDVEVHRVVDGHLLLERHRAFEEAFVHVIAKAAVDPEPRRLEMVLVRHLIPDMPCWSLGLGVSGSFLAGFAACVHRVHTLVLTLTRLLSGWPQRVQRVAYSTSLPEPPTCVCYNVPARGNAVLGRP